MLVKKDSTLHFCLTKENKAGEHFEVKLENRHGKEHVTHLKWNLACVLVLLSWSILLKRIGILSKPLKFKKYS